MNHNDKQHSEKPKSDPPELDDPLETALESDQAIDGEAESLAAASDTFEQAADDLPGTGLEISEVTGDEESEAAPAPQLERLQKILAKSGIASRRHAEELITSGRVQVNGKVVSELGSKADPARDHIRVDGKLLQGSERHRYFMLNKPKGYVTTVSDPEGRPTIMEFFSKTRERLYPVGRLDYLSEGLLLVTNDGELANKLTRASSGVEKTYLVKVSGQPSEEDLDRLRKGVPISKGKPGSARVHTAPAEIRPFRPGKPRGQRASAPSADNPWYEVVLIEGRNRELRKMFEEIGHHVEKIRRVGYGPLVLDLEPGQTRELEPEEVENLRKVAEGKYRKPKLREPRKRELSPRSDRPGSKPRWNEHQAQSRDADGREERRPFRTGQRDFQKKSEGGRRPARDRFRREPGGEPRREFRPGGRPNPSFAEDRSQRPPRRENQGGRPYSGAREDRGRFEEDQPRDRVGKSQRLSSRPPRRDFDAPAQREGARPNSRRFEGRPQQSRDASRSTRSERPSGRSSSRGDRRRFDRPFGENRPGQSREDRSARGQRAGRPRFDRPSFEDRGGQNREGRPPRRDREDQTRYERPREGERSQRTENRPPQTKRGSDQRTSSSRPAGNFRPGKRGAPGGKQGSVRSGGGRRQGSRPGASGSGPKRS